MCVAKVKGKLQEKTNISALPESRALKYALHEHASAEALLHIHTLANKIGRDMEAARKSLPPFFGADESRQEALLLWRRMARNMVCLALRRRTRWDL